MILSAIVSTSIVTFGYVNMYTIHKTTYNIVLDHQPQGTEENTKNNVNLQLSGHTHNGQMFPLSSLTTYNPTLRVITEKKHSSTTQKSLVQALLVGGFQ